MRQLELTSCQGRVHFCHQVISQSNERTMRSRSRDEESACANEARSQQQIWSLVLRGVGRTRVRRLGKQDFRVSLIVTCPSSLVLFVNNLCLWEISDALPMTIDVRQRITLLQCTSGYDNHFVSSCIYRVLHKFHTTRHLSPSCDVLNGTMCTLINAL